MYLSLPSLCFLGYVSLSCVVASTVRKSPAVFEERENAGSWVKRSRLPADVVLPVRVALAQSNLDSGEEHLMRVSDPTSPLFGQHWTTDGVIDTFAPSAQTVEVTTQWLEDFGISRERIMQTQNRGFLAFDSSTSELESLLQTEYYRYDHVEKGKSAVSTERYTVPTYLKKHIDYITPGVSFRSVTPKLKPTKSILAKRAATNCSAASASPAPAYPSQLASLDLNDLSLCSQFITPACVKALYNIPSNVTSNAGNSFAIYEFNGSPVQTDEDLFFQYVVPNIPIGTAPKIESFNNATIDFTLNTSVVFEANLDFELAWPIVYPLNITLLDSEFSTAQTALINNQSDVLTADGLEAFYEFGDVLGTIDGSFCTSEFGSACGIFSPPNVLSTSYGTDESLLTPAMEDRLCNEWLKLGLQGTSVFFSSGDRGVQGRTELCLGPFNASFGPALTTTCPWVTAVGGTQLLPNTSIADGEVAVLSGSYTSGGGFSNYHTAPSYQADALATYFQEHDPGYPYYNYSGNASIGANGGLYNRDGRGFPDVSASGLKLLNIDGGCVVLEGGTSASTPIVASIVTLINNERLNAGKGPVGFINPTLYANPGAFNDITQGHNIGCRTNGFSAVEGWDPVTGLGTPNYEKLKDIFLALP